MSLDSEIVVNLRENLKRLLDELDLTQADVAARAGISRVYLNNIMQGRHVPRIDIVGQLANALGVRAERLLRPVAKNLAQPA